MDKFVWCKNSFGPPWSVKNQTSGILMPGCHCCNRMLRLVVISFCVLFTVASGQSSQAGCIPDHCTCTVHNTTAIPAQPFNVDREDWRPIVLATALGAATSSLVLTVMAAWWTWKSSSLGPPNVPTTGDKPNMNPNARGDTPSASSEESWATQRNSRDPTSDNGWSSRLDSRGSDGYSARGKSDRKVWPGQFD